MKVYLDIILFLNFSFNLILLLAVSIILRRSANILNIIIGALVGGISIIFLFIKITSFQLFIFKIIVSIIMILISFGFQNIKYTLRNLVFLYTLSIVMGGFLYFLNIQFSYKNEGLVFFYKGLSINFIFLLIFCPFIIYIYIKQALWLRNNYSNYYKVKIKYNGNIINLTGFVDTGNNLFSPFSNKPIILIDKNIECKNYFFVPYKSVNHDGLLKCFKADLEINNKIYKEIIIGLLKDKIKIDGVSCLLNQKLMEGYND